MDKPLSKKKVLVTRSETQAKVFSAKLKKAGAVPLTAPLLTFTSRKNKENDNIFGQLHEFSWVFFTSANGVKFFFDYVKEMDINISSLRKIQFGVVGTKTEKALHNFGFSAAFKPINFQGKEMAREFIRKKHKKNEKILLINGNLSRDDIAVELMNQQVLFQKAILYDTLLNIEAKATLTRLLQTTAIDIYTFTSPSTIQAFMKLTADIPDLVSQVKKEKLCVCIGTTTKKEAERQGFVNIRVPGRFTIEGMIEEMKCYFTEER